MKTKYVFDEQFDEIVFQNRNKNYGAFFLRKAYKNHISKALLITISFSMLVSSIPLVAHYFKNDKIPEIKTTSYDFTFSDVQPQEEIKVKIPIIPPMKELEKAIEFSAFKVGKDTNNDNSEFIINTSNNKIVAFGTDTTNSDTFVDISSNIIIEIPDVEVHTWVEEMPYFPDGYEELLKYFIKNVIYPEPERDLGIMGVVVVTFIVEPDGSITNINIYKGETSNLNTEAIRLIENMPRWVSGKQNGVNVRVSINLPIRFTLM